MLHGFLLFPLLEAFFKNASIFLCNIIKKKRASIYSWFRIRMLHSVTEYPRKYLGFPCVFVVEKHCFNVSAPY